MPAAAHDLTLAATAAELLGVPNDAKLQRLVSASGRAVAGYLGYPVHRRVGVTETVEGLGGSYLFLKAGQVTALTAVAVDGVQLDPADFALDSALMGRIVSRRRAWPFTGTWSGGVSSTPLSALDEGRIQVTFDAGWVTPGQVDALAFPTRDLPEDLEQAALELLTTWVRRAGQDTEVSARALGDASLSWGTRSALPPVVRQLLAPYRKPTRRTF